MRRPNAKVQRDKGVLPSSIAPQKNEYSHNAAGIPSLSKAWKGSHKRGIISTLLLSPFTNKVSCLILLAFMMKSFVVLFNSYNSSHHPAGYEHKNDNAMTSDSLSKASRSMSVPTARLAESLQHIRQITSDGSNPAFDCPNEPWVDTTEAHFEELHGKFVCKDILRHRHNGTKPLKGCGSPEKYQHWTHPLTWECRLKERLHSTIVERGLSECAFGILDIGSAGGDWVIALSGFEYARFAAVEAHPLTFMKLLRNLKVNDLLDSSQVSVYPVAVGDSTNNDIALTQDKTSVSWPKSEYIEISSWPGSSLCVYSHDKQSYYWKNGVISGGQLSNSKNGCTEREVGVPIISVDMIMEDWQGRQSPNDEGQLTVGGLFAAKIDIEGAEREAVKSATESFGDPNQRPCQIYIELKYSKRDRGAYTEAFERILSLGYTDYIDVNSGIAGDGSFPPQGAMYPEEGNYELRLPAAEFDECVERVQQKACSTTR